MLQASLTRSFFINMNYVFDGWNQTFYLVVNNGVFYVKMTYGVYSTSNRWLIHDLYLWYKLHQNITLS
jgi:hypothetical protein